jgi:hypothetical protein
MVKMEKYDKIWEKDVGKVRKICENEKNDWKKILMEMTY